MKEKENAGQALCIFFSCYQPFSMFFLPPQQSDFRSRGTVDGLRDMINDLLAMNVVPIINENDAIAPPTVGAYVSLPLDLLLNCNYCLCVCVCVRGCSHFLSFLCLGLFSFFLFLSLSLSQIRSWKMCFRSPTTTAWLQMWP